MITLLTFLVGGFFGWLHMHDQNITDAATSAYNAMQSEVYQQKSEEYVQKTQAITSDAIQIASNVNQQNSSTQSNLDAIQTKAINDAPDEKRPSSIYLKSIIKQLNITYGVKK